MKSNITIYFAEGNHGDSMLFDGIDEELVHSNLDTILIELDN